MVDVTSGQFWVALVGLIVSILGGGLAMAWRLGRLEGKVDNTLEDHERRITDSEHDVADVWRHLWGRGPPAPPRRR